MVIARGFTAHTLKRRNIPCAELKSTGYDVMKAVNQCMQKGNIERIAAVSYTHLDVYKRQVEWMEQTGKALRLSQQGAQAIVEEVGAIVGQNINMMDPEGYVIASTDPERIGTLHEGARKIIREHLDELYVRDEEATFTSRPGLNLPVYQAGSIAGVIGITGRYEEVAGYGQIVKKMVEILIRENAEQDERRMGQRVLNRFLEDWEMCIRDRCHLHILFMTTHFQSIRELLNIKAKETVINVRFQKRK